MDALHATYCSQGVNVTYERTLVGEHIVALGPFFLQALPYLQGAFSGKPAINPLAASCK